jgi:GT2 family glycosyltransferase
MDCPSVSVIIATYNRDEPLCSAISSVLAQRYPGKMQLIVVDQTPGHSEEVAAFLHQHEKEIRYLRLAEPNLPAARNAGIAEACGELLLFVDDDIILPRDAVSRLASHFQTQGSRALSGLVLPEKDPETSLKQYAQECGPRVLSPNSNLIEARRFIGALMCVPGETVRRVGGFDEKLGRLTPTAFGEDYDFCHRLRKAHVPLFIDPSVRVTHRDHVAGGCESRKIDPDLAVRYQVRARAYMSLKHYGRVGLRGWGRILRGFVLNRATLRVGIRHVLRRFSLARRAVAEARGFATVERAGPSRR